MDIRPALQYGSRGWSMTADDVAAMELVITEVINERKLQDFKLGQQTHTPAAWYTILGEEYGEIGRAINENDVRNYRDELIQTAAVCVAMVESIDVQLRDAS